MATRAAESQGSVIQKLRTVTFMRGNLCEGRLCTETIRHHFIESSCTFKKWFPPPKNNVFQVKYFKKLISYCIFFKKKKIVFHQCFRTNCFAKKVRKCEIVSGIFAQIFRKCDSAPKLLRAISLKALVLSKKSFFSTPQKTTFFK